MNNDVLAAIVSAPVQCNVYPCHAPDTIRQFIRVLKEEGFPSIEILARPLQPALDLMQAVNTFEERQWIHLGMGTVRTEADARQVVALRPDFIVSPAFSRRVLQVAVDAGLPYIPGVSTLQDVQDIIEAFADVGRDLRVLKLCPVVDMSLDYVRAMGTIYPDIVFCPTGFVPVERFSEWRAIPFIGPPMQSNYISAEMLDAGDWDAVRTRLRELRTASKRE